MAKERIDDAGSVAEAVFFVWDGNRLAEETHVHGGDRRTSITYEYTPDSHRPVVQDRREWLRDAPRHEVDRRFRLIVGNLAGASTELLSPEGEVTWRNRSTLGGGEIPESGESECPLRFPGQYFDAERELHYNYFRYYDPVSGRYISPDPPGLAAGPDEYAYAVNPLTWCDPLGLQSCPTFKGLA